MHRIWPTHLQPTQMRTHGCHPGNRSHLKPPSAASRAAAPRQHHRYVFDIDAVVAGLHELSTHWAFEAAGTAFPGCAIPGSPQLYQRYMQQLLPVTRQPYEAALLIRLLADEGIVGSRSVAGREGPVVGRPIRHSGSRPLLLQEITEFWEDEVMPTCLLRWSRQMNMKSQQLQQRVAEAYFQAQHSGGWQLFDAQQTCYADGSSSSSDGGGSSSRSSSTGSGSSSSSSNHRHQQASATATAAISRPAAVLLSNSNSTQQQQQKQLYVTDAAATTAAATVQPYTAVLQAILRCKQHTYIMSTYPPAVTHAVLAAAGLTSSSSSSSSSSSGGSSRAGSSHIEVLQAGDIGACCQQLQIQQQQQQQQQQQPGCLPPSSSGGSSSSSSSSAACTFIMSSPSGAAAVREALQLTDSGQQQQRQQRQQQRRHAVSKEARLQVGDWVCCAPSLRAKALASSEGDMCLLSEVGLAEMLGVSDCDAVMDGIAWRGRETL